MTSTCTHPLKDEKAKTTHNYELANLATCFNKFKCNYPVFLISNRAKGIRVNLLHLKAGDK